MNWTNKLALAILSMAAAIASAETAQEAQIKKIDRTQDGYQYQGRFGHQDALRQPV
ncbi:hypothetical protein ACFS07_04865 [Undibacterium arcticum]